MYGVFLKKHLVCRYMMPIKTMTMMRINRIKMEENCRHLRLAHRLILVCLRAGHLLRGLRDQWMRLRR
jgi:hypothetical protein